MEKFIKIALFVSITVFLFSCATGPAPDEDFNKLIGELRNEINYIDSTSLHDSAIDYVIKGSNLQQQGKHAEAILELQQALKYDSSASIYYAIARNYKMLDMLERATEYTLLSLERESEFVPAIELLAEVYVLRSDLDKAIKAYKRAIELEPSRNKKHYLGRLYEYRDVEEAIRIYEELNDEGEDEIILTRLSNLYRMQGMNDKYIWSLEKLYEYRPNRSNADHILDYYLEKKQYEKVFSFLDKLDRSLMSSELPAFYGFVAGGLYDDTSSSVYTHIEHYLERTKNRFHFDWRILILNGFLYDKTGDTVMRDEYFGKTLAISDSIPDAPVQIGLFYIQEDNRQQALEVLTRFSDNFPDDKRYPLFIGNIHSINEDFEKALLPLKKALSIDTLDVSVWAQLGIVYDRLGLADSSDYFYEKALELDPDDPLVNNNYAYSLCERGIDIARALTMSEKALAGDPDNSAYLDTYGWIQFRLGNLDKALEYILKSIETGEASAEVYEHLADVYLKLNRRMDAISALKDALEKDPGRETSREKLKLLE